MKQQLPNRLRIAVALFPELSLLPEGGFWDKYGIDGYIKKRSVQCKHDTRIATSGNIWHEIYEKTALNDQQLWRASSGKADLYLFTTETVLSYVGYLIKTHTLAVLENGRVLKTIFPNNGAATSMGFLLSLKDFGGDIEKRMLPKSREPGKD